MTTQVSNTNKPHPFKFDDEDYKNQFQKLGQNGGLRFQIQEVFYRLVETTNGHVIQPEKDYVNSRYTGFYVSKDFCVFKNDNQASTLEAMDRINNIVTATLLPETQLA